MIEFIIAVILIINPLTIGSVQAEQYYFNTESGSGPQKIESNNLGVKITASKFLVKDVGTSKILYAKDNQEKAPIASLTKLMTALVFLETNPDWQAQVKMEQRDETDGAYPHIYRGEAATVKDLFNTMLVSSDNNSAKALVRITGMTEKQFIQKMNQFAKKNDLINTNFEDVAGLSDKNVSNADEIAQLLIMALEKSAIADALIQPGYNFKILNSEKTRKVYTTNRILESFLNSEKHGYQVIGGKTGYLPEAGGCLAVVIEKDGHRIISVVLASNNAQTRFQDTKALVDWVSLNYEWN